MDLLSLLEDDTDPPNVDNSLVVSHLDEAVAADQPLPLQPVQQIDESLQLESLEERNCRIRRWLAKSVRETWWGAREGFIGFAYAPCKNAAKESQL